MLNIVDQPLHSSRQSALIMLLDRGDRVDGPIPLKFCQFETLAKLLKIGGCDIPFVGDD